MLAWDTESSGHSLAAAGSAAAAAAAVPAPADADAAFRWTAGKVFLSLFLFVAAGVAEIGGGWLVWQAVRLHKGWYLAVAGAVVLFVYGLIPCAQPLDNFGRVGAGLG
jgi:small multidrug resistance family-3 protein